MRKQIIKAILIFIAPLFLAVLLYILDENPRVIHVFIGLSPVILASTYFSFRRFYLIYKLSKVGVEVTATYRALMKAALGLGLIKVRFSLNGKEEVCCIYDCRSGNKKYKLLIDPNNFKHYLIMGVEN